MFQSKRLGLVLGAIGFSALLALGAPPANAGAFGEPVSFVSVVYPPTAFKVKKAKEQGIVLETKKGETIIGTLYRPDSAGALPAVILMHGCGGIGLWNRVWRQRLVDWGYIVLDMDSCSAPGSVVSVRSGRGLGPVKRISHVEARPHKVLSFCW